MARLCKASVPSEKTFLCAKACSNPHRNRRKQGEGRGGEGGQGSGTGDRRWLGANLGYLERQLVRTCALGSAGQLLPKLNFLLLAS